MDLTALLYKYEVDIAWIIENKFGGNLKHPPSPSGGSDANIYSSSCWLDRAARRKDLANRLLWNAEKAMYCDYNTRTCRQTPFESVNTFWTLWSGLADQRQAECMVKETLPKFECIGGVTASTKGSASMIGSSNGRMRQWDYPFGWAPHQILVWDGLRRYGFLKDMERLIFRWLHLVTRVSVDFNGTVSERYDVTTLENPFENDAEYGCQGRDFKGVAEEGWVNLLPGRLRAKTNAASFGWTNASYTYGFANLSGSLQEALRQGRRWDNVE